MLGYSNLAIGGLLILGIPIILVSIIAIRKIDLFNITSHCGYSLVTKPNILIYNLCFILLYILSIIVAMFGRNYVYFLFICLMTCILILEMRYSRFYNLFNYIVLTKLVLVILNLSLSYTLKHAVSIFSTDVFFHFGFINFILDKGYIADELGIYKYFPLYHIYYAIGFLITNSINWNMFYFLSALLFSTSVFSMYLLVSHITKSERHALMASVIYIFIPAILYDSMFTITRTLAYILLMNITYMIFREKTDTRITFLAVFLIIPATLMHNTTLVFFGGLFLLYFILDVFIVNAKKISFLYTLLFMIAFIGYLIFIAGPVFASWTNVLAEIREPIAIGAGASSYFYQNLFLNINYGILVFFSLIGSYSYLIKNKNILKTGNIIALSAILVLPFQVPMVSSLLTSLLGYRIPTILAPLVAFSASAGFIHCFDNWGARNKARYLGLFWIILLLIFCIQSSLIVGKQIETNMLPDIYGQYNRNYLVDAELKSFDFCNKYIDKIYVIYTDYLASRYLWGYKNMRSSYSQEGPDLVIASNDVFLLRDDEYKSSGRLHFMGISSTAGKGFRDINIIYMEYTNNSNLSNIWSENDKIYYNKDVSIYKRAL